MAAFLLPSAPKKGVVYQARSKEPYRDYLVNAEWIWTLLQGQKIELSDARMEFVHNVKNLNRHMPNLEVYERVLNAKALEERIREKARQFEKTRKPFRRIPEVQRFFALHNRMAERRPFLVIEGPLAYGQDAVRLFARGARS